MTENTSTVERYLDGFRRSDHALVLSCLTDDVEWEIPGLFHVHGKEAFDKHIQDEGFVGSPVIAVTRMTEANDIVVAEIGSSATEGRDPLEPGLLRRVRDAGRQDDRRLISYLMETPYRSAQSG